MWANDRLAIDRSLCFDNDIIDSRTGILFAYPDRGVNVNVSGGFDIYVLILINFQFTLILYG